MEIKEAPFKEEPSLFEKKSHIFRLRGRVLDDVAKANEALGVDPRDKLRSLRDTGLTEEEIAASLSKGEEKIFTYAVFVLEKMYNASAIAVNRDILQVAEGREVLDSLNQANEISFLNNLEDIELIIYFTRYFGSPLSRKRVASDIGISVSKLIRIENGMIEKGRKTLESQVDQ